MSISAGVLHYGEKDKSEDTKYIVEKLIKLGDNKIFLRLRVNGRMFDVEFGPEKLRDIKNMSDSQNFEQEYLDALRHSFGDDDDDMSSEPVEQEDDLDIANSPVSITQHLQKFHSEIIHTFP
ncbi:hypothetical protein UCRPC4_g04366 [Phaeomoniella chlamydospora]|uniref:Uncharacterized protein n=1 Tax=Phaeomoniella chlamydospora TaxID=158046 RepID=A0A0G2EBS4_PHACM|nr:hypothetical protein UCRPC4_g04366 [Phaeomoniella chlamydospora]